MAGKRTHVSKFNEIERLLELGLTSQAISRALSVSRNTVKAVREKKSEIETETPEITAGQTTKWVDLVPWEDIHREVQAGVTLHVLWGEEVDNGRVPVQYSAFWKQYEKRYPESTVSMHRVFQSGSRAEIDYCDGIDIYDPTTGEILKTELFVGVLCHSRYAFAEFSMSQKSEDFLRSHVRMFEFFGGVPAVASPDNLKSAVTKSHRYDPVLNPAYTRLAEHYNIGIVPAQVRSPKHKAVVERTIQIFQRWFFATVRHRTFTSLVELNACLRDHLTIFNNKTHRIFRRSPAEMFNSEKNFLQPLPEHVYEVVIHHRARVHPDCHIAFEKNFYSAPEALRGKLLDVWAGEKTIEIFHEGQRVAVHQRSKGKGQFVTQRNHYPEAHRAYSEAIPSHAKSQAARIGPQTSELVECMLAGNTPLKNLRRAQGIIGLAKKYPAELIEEACSAALRLNQKNYIFVERMLKHKKGGQPTGKTRSLENGTILRGENPLLRGETLFHQGIILK
jgi:transposase